MIDFIFHITSRVSWSEAQKAGLYSVDSLTNEGFIHCSKLSQILRVANSYCANQREQVLLVIDPSRLIHPVRWEAGTDKADELFPHLYGPLNLDAVVSVLDLEPGLDGKFHLPAALASVDL